MSDVLKSMFSFVIATSLFGLKQLHNAVLSEEHNERRGRSAGQRPAVNAFVAVTNSTTEQFGETLLSIFRVLDNLQRGTVGLAFSMCTPFPHRHYCLRESACRADSPEKSRESENVGTH